MHTRTVLQVNAKSDGKAAIHSAAVTGNVSVLQLLLDFRANLELEVSQLVTTSAPPPSCDVSLLQDDTGKRALHHSVLQYAPAA